MNKFTFGVLAYNQEKIICETLESIKYQIEKYGENYEVSIIITDDASHDNTVMMCQKWLDLNSNLFVNSELIANKNNQGTVTNYNAIMNKIQDEPFKIIAGDDVLSSANSMEFINNLHNDTIQSHIMFALVDDTIICTDDYIVKFYRKMQKSHNIDLVLHDFRRGSYLNTPSTIYKKSQYVKGKCSEATRGYKYLEDEPTWYAMLKNIPNVSVNFDSTPIVLYRIHGGSVSNSEKKNSPFDEELNHFRKYLVNDTKGIEKICLQYDYLQWLPKYLRINKYFEYVKGVFYKIRYSQDQEYQNLKSYIHRLLKDEQNYYEYIKTTATNLYK